MGIANSRLQFFFWKKGCEEQHGYKSGVVDLKAASLCHLQWSPASWSLFSNAEMQFVCVVYHLCFLSVPGMKLMC